jgi:hypothetical protein
LVPSSTRNRSLQAPASGSQISSTLPVSSLGVTVARIWLRTTRSQRFGLKRGWPP